MLLIRKALPEDLTWVNAQYQEIGFQLSDYSKELIAIAEWGGERAGVGRLVSVTDNVLELGGMYVLEDYRNYGIARALVSFLLDQVVNTTLYCLPFEHLQHFYKSFGFRQVNNLDQVPERILQKWEWCNQTYSDKTLLLMRQV